MTVVGVLPASFDFGSVFAPGLKIDIYVPAVMDLLRNAGNTLALLGRLKPGVTVAQAQAEVDILMPQIRAAHKDWYDDYATAMTELKDHVSGKLRRSLVVLWCAVGLILLIVCVNLSNLLLARAAARSKEFAMRSALGAGRGRDRPPTADRKPGAGGRAASFWAGHRVRRRTFVSRPAGIDCPSAAEHHTDRRRRAGLDAADRRWPPRFCLVSRRA